MTSAAALELAIVTGSLAAGAAGAIAALRTRATARADRLALRLARAREGALVESARRLADAARASVVAVREEIARSARVVAPSVDGVLLYEEHDGALRCVYAAGERLDYFAGSRIALDDEGALPVMALCAGHRVTLADGARPLHPCDAAALAVPLAQSDGRACILAVCARTALDADARERLVTLADQASPAYGIALDREDDRRRAEYDGLTGLLTPRAFRQRLTALTDRARHVPTARHALLFLDTDRFKDWNDKFGHASGDALLRALAHLLRTEAKNEHDLIARNGGDEFCLVFAESGKADAIERAEVLRRRIAEADFSGLRPTEQSGEVRISASIGVAAYPVDARGANDLLERADAAMYHSKRTGRDAVSYTGVDGELVRLEAREYLASANVPSREFRAEDREGFSFSTSL
jgi:diguanylate cyclase (GGDEF)-like protein